MSLLHNRFRQVFGAAVIPGILAVVILILGVTETAPSDPVKVQSFINSNDLHQLGRPYWGIATAGMILTLARFSEAFLVLRATSVGLPASLSPLVLVVMNIIYAASAYPSGALSDRKALLGIGFIVLILADLVLAFASRIPMVMFGIGLWGVHMGLTQGLLAALVADVAPAKLRGTAFGLFNFTSGIALLIASLVAGSLWQWFGPSATFISGAIFTVIGLIGPLIFVLRERYSE